MDSLNPQNPDASFLKEQLIQTAVSIASDSLARPSGKTRTGKTTSSKTTPVMEDEPVVEKEPISAAALASAYEQVAWQI